MCLRGKRQDRKTIWLPVSGKMHLVCSRVRTVLLSRVGVCLTLGFVLTLPLTILKRDQTEIFQDFRICGPESIYFL